MPLFLSSYPLPQRIRPYQPKDVKAPGGQVHIKPSFQQIITLPRSRELHVPPRRINEIIHGKRAIFADTALRLSRFFGTTAEFWLGLQANYELDMAREVLGERIAEEVKRFAESSLRDSEADRLLQQSS